MQYKVTYPDGYSYEVEAEVCEKGPRGNIVLLSANRTAIATIADGNGVTITDAGGHEVTPTASN